MIRKGWDEMPVTYGSKSSDIRLSRSHQDSHLGSACSNAIIQQSASWEVVEALVNCSLHIRVQAGARRSARESDAALERPMAQVPATSGLRFTLMGNALSDLSLFAALSALAGIVGVNECLREPWLGQSWSAEPPPLVLAKRAQDGVGRPWLAAALVGPRDRKCAPGDDP